MTRSKHIGKGNRTIKISMTMRVVKTYYWIQNFIKENGRSPTNIEIGEWVCGSGNYYTARNIGIQVCEPLIAQGFIVREGHGRGSQIRITDKPFTEVNLVK